ncbi:MAG: aldo/keto reductase [Candidatus Bathyarchaeota archaeon]|nr:MAG: aldo/keto reductase [Candidatus Bathyarchaeota archaeon]
MIPKSQFGRTGHASTRSVFGSWALRKASQAEADRILDILLEYRVNHIDTAPMYGNAEKCIGSWMEQHRDDFFLATKSRRRTYKEAWEGLQRSLSRLRVDYVDLWQMHGLTSPSGWEKAMGSGGALEAFIEARDQGLVKFLGVTGHGNQAPAMHMRSLERFDFDTVMLPYNYLLKQDLSYSADFNELVGLCRKRGVALQTMKCLARLPCRGGSKTYNTYFYEPLESQDAIDKAVHWALGFQNSFVITVGDMQLLPMMLDAVNRFERRPSDMEMSALVEELAMQRIFPVATRRKGSHRVQGKGPHTWGGQMSRALGGLIREGFFQHPNMRTLADVIKAFESKDLSTKDKESNITNALVARVRKGILKRRKISKAWVYWTE